MKKNDFATFLVYIGMFGIALLVGLTIIRPTIADYGNSLEINAIALVILSVIAGILVNGVGLELLHMAGAAAGNYTILSVSFFGITFRKKDGKLRVSFAAFDGLTGETRVAPKDVQNSSLSAYIALPLIGIFVEVIATIIMIVVARARIKGGQPSAAGMEIFAEVMLAAGGMILLYNIFPAHLDSTTDGYLMVLLSKDVNRVAFNQILLAENGKEIGIDAGEIPVYDTVTDFTYRLNNIVVYQKIEKGEFDEAIAILEKTIATEKGVSPSLINDASCIKLSLLLMKDDTSAGRAYYEGFSDAQRKYVASMETSAAMRCYVLVSGLIEESCTETNFALGKADRLIKHCNDNEKPVEKKLLIDSLKRIKGIHVDWDLDYEIEEPAKEE